VLLGGVWLRRQAELGSHLLEAAESYLLFATDLVLCGDFQMHQSGSRHLLVIVRLGSLLFGSLFLPCDYLGGIGLVLYHTG
jgi:hypothetical protein